MISEHEFAEVKAQLEEFQRQLWILTQGDNWLKNVKTQPLAPSGTAPSNADYLVGTGNALLTNEIAVGATPGGELGGSWASPTVDSTHSGSAHHAESHNVASHNDTTATGTELETLTDGSDADALHTHSADGIDTAAIHDNVANEITAITAKATPVAADEFVLEDSAASFVKKAVTFANLESTISHDSIADVSADDHHAQAHGGDHTDGTDDIQDAAADDSTKGIATFEADDFDSASGKIDLAASVPKTVNTDSGAATPSANAFTITGGEGIDTSGAGNAVTIAGENASGTNKGIVELATAAEINTGSDTGRAIPIDQFVASNRNIRFITFRLIEADTDCATDTTVGGDWVCPFTGTLLQDDSNKNWCSANNDTAGVTGTMVVDVHKGGTTVMATNKLDIETGEKSTNTATTQPDLTVTAVTAGDVFTFDIDAIHTTAAKGLSVTLAIRMT